MSCQLGKIASLSKGEGISKDQRSINGNPCILYGELYTTYSTEIIDKVISKTNLPEKGLVKSKANDVIIPASGETAIDISTARCVTRSDVFLGGDLNIIRLNFSVTNSTVFGKKILPRLHKESQLFICMAVTLRQFKLIIPR